MERCLGCEKQVTIYSPLNAFFCGADPFRFRNFTRFFLRTPELLKVIGGDSNGNTDFLSALLDSYDLPAAFHAYRPVRIDIF